MNIQDAIALIEKFAKYEGTELAEGWTSLLNLYWRLDYVGGGGLDKAVKKAILFQANWIEENLQLKETTETYTKTYTSVEEKD